MPAAQPLPGPGELALAPRLLYHAAVAGDYALRTGLASAVAGSMVPGTVAGGWTRERRRLAFYAELAEARDPRAVFVEPERAEVLATPGRGPGVDGGRVELLRFASAYRARNPALEREYARHVNNATARAQHWRHADGPHPTLVVVHGFGASPAWLNTAFFSLREFFADGWDVVLVTLPFHGSRRSGRWPLNGIELFAHGMAHFSEGILHAVHDIRVLLAHLEAQGVPRVGMTGLSLGGYVTGLMAALEPRLDFAVPNAAVTWIPPLLGDWFPANLSGAVLRWMSGVPGDLLASALAVHSPLTYPAALPEERLMIVAGLGDRLAPPEQSTMLWEHWGRPELHWFPGSHVLHFGRGAYLEAMRALMGAPDELAATAA
jgi:pimeloyl-ACP methyl ester carboxylesterase